MNCTYLNLLFFLISKVNLSVYMSIEIEETKNKYSKW